MTPYILYKFMGEPIFSYFIFRVSMHSLSAIFPVTSTNTHCVKSKISGSVAFPLISSTMPLMLNESNTGGIKTRFFCSIFNDGIIRLCVVNIAVTTHLHKTVISTAPPHAKTIPPLTKCSPTNARVIVMSM